MTVCVTEMSDTKWICKSSQSKNFNIFCFRLKARQNSKLETLMNTLLLISVAFCKIEMGKPVEGQTLVTTKTNGASTWRPTLPEWMTSRFRKPEERTRQEFKLKEPVEKSAGRSRIFAEPKKDLESIRMNEMARNGQLLRVKVPDFKQNFDRIEKEVFDIEKKAKAFERKYKDKSITNWNKKAAVNDMLTHLTRIDYAKPKLEFWRDQTVELDKSGQKVTSLPEMKNWGNSGIDILKDALKRIEETNPGINKALEDISNQFIPSK